jgi:hypothetical protein
MLNFYRRPHRGPEVSRRPLLSSDESLTVGRLVHIVLSLADRTHVASRVPVKLVFRQSGSPMAHSPFSGGSGPTAQRPHTTKDTEQGNYDPGPDLIDPGVSASLSRVPFNDYEWLLGSHKLESF